MVFGCLSGVVIGFMVVESLEIVVDVVIIEDILEVGVGFIGCVGLLGVLGIVVVFGEPDCWPPKATMF